jgi:hypothetical protein
MLEKPPNTPEEGSRDPYEFDVFLNRATEDTEWLERLAERLRNAGVRAWFDRGQIQPSHNINDHINQGLEQSRKLARSGWSITSSIAKYGPWPRAMPSNTKMFWAENAV